MSKRLRILLDGYIDGNFGDDLMLYLAANGLKEHKLYITCLLYTSDAADEL